MAGWLQAADITHTRDFDLGPGETAFGLEFPQFNTAAYPATPILNRVTVTLTFEFSAEVQLFFDPQPASGANVEWSLGPAEVEAVGNGTGLIAPALAQATLTGTTFVPATGTAVVDPTPTQSASSATWIEGTGMAPYEGAGSVFYEVDFTAFYWMVAARRVNQPAPDPAATGLFTSDRVRGTLAVTYKASSTAPTPVLLADFSAVATGGDRVWVQWQTGVESNLLGFHLERLGAGGGWVRLTRQLLPATGGSQTARYVFDDRAVPSSGGLTYRLLAVDLQGEESVLGETAVRPGFVAAIDLRDGATIEITVRGEPNGRATLETTVDAAHGPWQAVGTVDFDGRGLGALTLGLSTSEPARFYRVRQIP